MKRILNYLLLICTLHLVACSSENLQEKETLLENNKISTIGATISSFEMDNAESRVSISMGKWPNFGDVVWAEGDTIGIYPSVGDQLSFPIVDGIGKNYCEFNGGGWALKTSTSYTAYTPFNRSYYLYKKNDALPVSMLNQKQIGNNNSDHVGAYDIQIAKGTTPTDGKISFAFQHQVSFVRMDLIAPCAATWKSITLESDVAFTTKAKMNLSLETPTITPTLQTNSVTLDLENVNTNDSLHIVAYMMMLPVDFTDKTLEVILTDADDNIYTAPATIVNNKFNFTAASARWINAEFEETTKIDDPTPYVTFKSNATQTFTMSRVVETLEYSVNEGEWSSLGTSTIVFGGDYGNLRIRGKNSNGTNGATILFGNSTLVSCTGDIRTIINYETYMTTETEKAGFSYLFKNCTSLTSSPKLPTTNLKGSCYSNMFYGCTNLATAPELPATVLADNCYSKMFYGCTSLTTAPVLPATVLAGRCYSEMFYGCTNLATAPELPATVLTDYCYSSMFYGCTNLATAPELPATVLAENCYSSMFSSCTNLKKAPELRATILAKGCYYHMFYECTDLTTAPELPATILVNNCYFYMFAYCSNLTIVPELPASILAENCYHSMFYKCTNLTIAPELPATVLAKDCYHSMFNGCTSLATAPELPATVLAENCYSNMFSWCNNLEKAPELPATVLAENCYNNMFSWCTNLEKAPELPATVLANSCYSNMFSWCTNLEKAPELPATVLANSCYSNMFSWCTNLEKAPELPATVLAENCYKQMFSKCENLTEVPILPASKLEDSCYNEMFEYCAKLNKVIMLATDITAKDCLYNWLYSVSSIGTFTKAEEMISLPSGISGIPNGWSILIYEE